MVDPLPRSLSSCNYECDYCPFAKTANTWEELAQDASEVARFTQWVAARKESIGVLFTPWGEALGHRAYQHAIVSLSHAANVRRVAIQTNLSARLDWLKLCNTSTVALWTTWHPGQVSIKRFVGQCDKLDALGIRHSVGVVGVKEAFGEIEKLRRAISPATYLWINAWKRQTDYYSEAEIRRLEAVDPHFRYNLVRHPSLGAACRAGHSVFSVDGTGSARRCHFVREIIGNIYDSDFSSSLKRRSCPAETCGCHIGYVHLEPLELYPLFGNGVLERIPARWPSSASTTAPPA